MSFILGEFLSFTNCQYGVDVENEAWKKLTSNLWSMEKCYKLRYKNVPAMQTRSKQSWINILEPLDFKFKIGQIFSFVNVAHATTYIA